jgi:hypothetical protein
MNLSRNTGKKRSALCRVYKSRNPKTMIMTRRYHGSGKQGGNNGAGQGMKGNSQMLVVVQDLTRIRTEVTLI